jgi:hypothetical protein
VEFFEAGEDAAKAFQSAEQSLDLIALAVHGLVILPGFETIAPGWTTGVPTKRAQQVRGFEIVFLAFNLRFAR